MGIIRNGGNGAFSGKAGSFIGSNWKNVDYIKGIPKLSKKPATQKQLDQRVRFGVVATHLGQVKDILNMGFKLKEQGRATGFNLAVQHAINNAVLGSYPTYEIDHSQVLISKGTLAKAIVSATLPESFTLRLNWMVILNGRNSFPSDKLFVLIYSPVLNLFLDFENSALRSTGTVDIMLQEEFAEQQLHVYTFFQHDDNSRCSESQYAGVITLNL